MSSNGLASSRNQDILDVGRVLESAQRIRNEILRTPSLSADLDPIIESIPQLFQGDGPIKLLIIGQDPTIRNIGSRGSIQTVLNLDKKDSLYKYLNRLASQLELDLAKNVYATNLWKAFFKVPPADDPEILKRHLPMWSGLLKEEISCFPNACIITLGEPLLEQLVHTGNKKVSHYWDYIGRKQSGERFRCVGANQNVLHRDLFPFPHQPAYAKIGFYKNYFDRYCMFVKQRSAGTKAS